MTIIDPEQLMEHIDGDLELLQETYEMFYEESKSAQFQLRTAISAGDLESVQSVAHGLKGMLANFMAIPACETAGEIEQISNNDALADALPLMNRLSDQIDTILVEIKQILKFGSA